MPDITVTEMADAVFEAAQLENWRVEALRARIVPPIPDIIDLADMEIRAERLVAAHAQLRKLAGGVG